jgi:autonomous glycyl radical cofactor GrcA
MTHPPRPAQLTLDGSGFDPGLLSRTSLQQMDLYAREFILMHLLRNL